MVFYSRMGKIQEKLKMVQTLAPKENIEVWLLELEDIMKQTVKKYSKDAANSIIIDNRLEVAMDDYLRCPSQCALMGMQMYWTYNCEAFIFTKFKMEQTGQKKSK